MRHEKRTRACAGQERHRHPEGCEGKEKKFDEGNNNKVNVGKGRIRRGKEGGLPRHTTCGLRVGRIWRTEETTKNEQKR